MSTEYNVLSGKKWVVCGDSFTNGLEQNAPISEGPYRGHRSVYPYLIANRNDMELVPFFEGGRTLAFPPEPGAFRNSLTAPDMPWNYRNIPEDADYITIYLGINDSHHAPHASSGDGEDITGKIPLGSLEDDTIHSFGGAWNVVLWWLIQNRPRAHIGIIVSNGVETQTYRDMTIAAAKKYGLAYLDLNGDSHTPAMIRTVNPDVADFVKEELKRRWAVDYTGALTGSSNTHPNDAAHLYESYIIEEFLRSI